MPLPLNDPSPVTSAPSGAPSPVRTVPCPACGEDSVFAPSNVWRPFCSERCRQHDLGAWASEQYRVGAIEPPDDFDGAA